MNTKNCVFLSAFVLNFMLSDIALSDELDNKMKSSIKDCGKSEVIPGDLNPGILTSIDALCKLVDLTGAGCETKTNTCGESTQELFSGTKIELATLKNNKNWNGFGGLGSQYNSALVCLMRDIKDQANQKIVSTTPENSMKVSAEQQIGIISFDPKTPSFSGYHRLRACGPVVGCIDIFTQKFSLNALSTDVKPKSLKAGLYEIKESYANVVSAEGIAQAFVTKFPSITVPTPVGPIDVKPEFRIGRAVGLVGAPFEINQKSSFVNSSLPISENKTFDVYGRIAGAMFSQISPIDTALDNPEWTFSQKAWISTLALGGRDSLFTNEVWKPDSKIEFPPRPDLDISKARSNIEKIPNAYLGASAMVSYDIQSKLPQALRSKLGCSGNVKLCLEESSVYAKPSIDITFSSQLGFFQNEESYWKKTITGGEFSLPLIRADTFDQAKSLQIMAHANVSAITSIESGLKFKIKLVIDTFFTKLTKVLIDLKPKVIIPLAKTSKNSTERIVKADSLGSRVLKEGRFFQEYTSWDKANKAKPGTDGGFEAIAACLKSSEIPHQEPPAPVYHPGDPNELTEWALQPCNICVSWDDIEYKDDNNKDAHLQGEAFLILPTSQKAVADENKWVCGNSKQLGCYDLCDYDGANRKVVKTAVQIIKEGLTIEFPKNCRPFNPTIGN